MSRARVANLETITWQDDNYFAPASCGPVGRVGALTGDVTVWAKNSSACSKSLLGGAGDKLAVSCREPPLTHQAPSRAAMRNELL